MPKRKSVKKADLNTPSSTTTFLLAILIVILVLILWLVSAQNISGFSLLSGR